jgi:hypothetical protein
MNNELQSKEYRRFQGIEDIFNKRLSDNFKLHRFHPLRIKINTHFVDRLEERKLDKGLIVGMISVAIEKKLCEILYFTMLDKSVRNDRLVITRNGHYVGFTFSSTGILTARTVMLNRHRETGKIIEFLIDLNDEKG